MLHILFLLAGGAVGALARYGLVTGLRACCGDAFPVGTMAVNVLGCLLFGLLWARCGAGWSRSTNAFVFTGFLGAFTTFSTFAFEGVELAQQGRYAACALHVVAQNVLGFVGVLAGLWLGRGD